MLPAVARMILRHLPYAASRELQEVVQKQIDLEESGDLKWEREQSDAGVPEGFRVPYEEIFPEVNKEVCQGLQDKTRSAETLIEIFVKFLKRWRPTCESLSAEHKSYLMELAKRAVAEKNGPDGTRSAGVSSSLTHMSALDSKRNSLSKEILRAVEQELLMGGCDSA
jgi:hypothetical protein